MGLDPILVIGGNAPTAWLYGDRLRMGGVKLYADGALGSRGAWLKAPYADAPGNHGLQFVEDTKLREHHELGGARRIPDCNRRHWRCG